MSFWNDGWSQQYFMGWPPVGGVHLPSRLPPEFRRENQDLRIPLREDQLMGPQDFWHLLP